MFLSTGAGESASTFKRFQPAVNFEPPWKPVRLQQRIGRVRRLGPLQAIHCLTNGSVEERVWETRRLLLDVIN